MALQVLVEPAEPRGDLGEGDADGLHERSLARSAGERRAQRRRPARDLRRRRWRRLAGRRPARRRRDCRRVRRLAPAAASSRPGSRPAGRLELLGGAVDLLGEVAGDLVARGQRRAAPGPRSCSVPGCRAARAASTGCGSGSPTAVSTGDGTSPLRMIRRRRDSMTGSGIGTADSSATVYGWSGSRLRSRELASSTIRPRYITAIRSLMWRTTDRSWAMNR